MSNPAFIFVAERPQFILLFKFTSAVFILAVKSKGDLWRSGIHHKFYYSFDTILWRDS
jgi:hypothetical protein